MKISKARLIEIIKEELSAVHEGRDHEGEADDAFIQARQAGRPNRWEKAKQDGEADGAAGREPTPPHGFASKHYMEAYRDAFNRTAGSRAQQSRRGLKRISRPRSAGDFRSDMERFRKP